MVLEKNPPNHDIWELMHQISVGCVIKSPNDIWSDFKRQYLLTQIELENK